MITVHEVWSIPAASSLVDVDNVADVLVLVVSGVDGLGDVPGHGRVIEVVVDVVHDAAGHALEELGHAVAPAAGLAPGFARKKQPINTVNAHE